MLKKENNVLNIDINNWARPCDNCRSAACTVYCRADSAYLCTGCDVRIHATSLHERVYVCEACERAPAAFLCKADSASLCSTCDAEVHSANPLARRHVRVPILPIPGGSLVEPLRDPDQDSVFETIDEEDEDEAASWLLLNPVKNTNNNNGGFFSYGGEAMDEFLDLVNYSGTCQDSQCTDQYSDQQQSYNNDFPRKGYGGDSVVPVQSEIKTQIQHEHLNYQFGIEYDTLKSRYGYPASINHNVSAPSMDVGVVPESATSDLSISQPRPSKGTIDLFSTSPVQMPTQLTPMDREARVLRYREKKKTRKFEKTIRYASRKAYAETRPRIKGRFAKRTNLEVEVDQMFSTEGGYGIVPSY